MANQRESVETSESEVAVHWKEEEFFYPPRSFIAQANMTDEKIYERFSLDNFPDCFKEYADLLEWYQYWHTTLDTSDPLAGSGSSGARSTPATTASIGTWPSTATRRP